VATLQIHLVLSVLLEWRKQLMWSLTTLSPFVRQLTGRPDIDRPVANTNAPPQRISEPAPVVCIDYKAQSTFLSAIAVPDRKGDAMDEAGRLFSERFIPAGNQSR
jgi:hypothetical protein